MMAYCVKCRKNTKNLSLILKQKMVDYLCNQNVLNADLKSQDLWKNKKQKDYQVI